MSWPSVIILAPVAGRLSLEARIRSFGVVPDPATNSERLHWQGYSYYFDLSGAILADFEPEEVEQVTARIGEPYGAYVSCQSMDAARAFLGQVLLGFDGLLDTNHFEVLPAGEFLRLLTLHPQWDWRRTPSADLQPSSDSEGTHR
ncbi:hypothetical protein [Streptomyces chryseus]|uniref:hypothetical protein n=1 Tax=Streptomyces chryseus TaxID=68186 RepID=UPI00110FA380|nr:hypothetical protein [Streptomyces chryseus]GGX31414.1 hypothetical protein GCM10010353_53070 [Streptomyces chryseus]